MAYRDTGLHLDDPIVPRGDELTLDLDIFEGLLVTKDGVTFIPHVSIEGILSWTNDGNLPNPEPVDLKGTQGPPGAPGKCPIIGNNGNWWLYNQETESYEDSGKPASLGGSPTIVSGDVIEF